MSAAGSSRLDEAIGRVVAAPPPPAVAALGELLRRRFGSHALAILFHGSCRRANDDAGGIADLYVLVDNYRGAYGRALPALANRMLAPNVYYLEAPFEGRTTRAKYSVVSLATFERGTARWFHSYLWGRFAQPCGLLHAVDATVRACVVGALGAAVATLAARTLPMLPAEFDVATLWTEGLLLTYSTELRSERPERIRALYADAATELTAVTRALGEAHGWQLAASGRFKNPSAPGARASCARGWALRRVQGKMLSVLRLLKASFTFDGGVSYLAWKVERQSGVKVEITPFMRRFPRLGAIGAMWRTWRRGGFR